MKKIQVLILLMLSVFFTPLAFGQMSKEDEKRLKKLKKSMSLEEFKQKVEQYEAASAEKNKYQRQARSMSKNISKRDEEIQKLEEELAGFKKTVEPKKAEEYTDDFTKGIVFRVQIGAFRTKFLDLSKYTNHRRFHVEDLEDGTKKYTVGTFRDYWEADLFKKYIREMGITDAWVVSYQDDQRVDVTDVLGEEDVKAIQEGEDLNSDINGGKKE